MITAGTLQALQSTKIEASPVKGLVQTIVWRGTYAQLQSILSTYVTPYGYEYELEQEQKGTLWKLTYKNPEANFTYSWELQLHATEKDILFSNNLLNNQLTQQNRLRIDYFSKHLNDLKDTNFQPTPATDSASQAQIGLFYKMWNIRMLGAKTTTIFTPILKRKYTYPTGNEINDAASYLGYLHSNETLISVEQVPVDFWDILANAYPTGYGAVKHVEGQNTGGDIQMYNGWKKMGSTITIQPFNRKEISLEWHYGEYPVDLYNII